MRKPLVFSACIGCRVSLVVFKRLAWGPGTTSGASELAFVEVSPVSKSWFLPSQSPKGWQGRGWGCTVRDFRYATLA
jgi:hypothetical protein